MNNASMMSQNQTQQQMIVTGAQQDAAMGVGMPVIMPPGQMQQQQPSTAVGPTVQPFVYRKQGTRLLKNGGSHDKSSSSSSKSDGSASDGGEGDNADDHGDDVGDDGGDGGDGGD